MSNKNRGADVVMRQLAASGVDTIFTLSGNHIMSLFDAAIDTGARLVHTRHEAAAVHMADAYGRLTGRPGVAMVTGGPGHANATGALFTALGGDAPIVLLSGHAPTTQLGWGAFQELDQAAMAAPVTKASWTAASLETLADDVARALEIAASGRPGPVHLSLPSDLLDAELAEAVGVAQAAPSFEAQDQSEAWSTAAAWLSSAKRPVLVGGPAFARDVLNDQFHEMARLLGVPGVVQESPRGLNDPSLGAFAGVLAKADVVVLANKALDFTMKFGAPPHWAADAKAIAISADEGQLAFARDRKGADAVAIHADAAQTISALSQMEGKVRGMDAGWADEVTAAVAYRPAGWDGPQDAAPNKLHPLDMCLAIRPFIARDPSAILICDGGEIGQWAQATLTSRRRITNSVTGSIGASLPFALAARALDPDATVFTIMGDGTIGFHLAEFETAVRCGLPFVLVVGNDANWNAEHQIQLGDYGADRAKGCELLPAAYDEVCASLGGFGVRVSKPEEMTPAIEAALASGLPACINVMLDGRGAPAIRRSA